MSVTAAQVKELRQKTGVGMMECKKATKSVATSKRSFTFVKEACLALQKKLTALLLKVLLRF